jgi:hypothetical protein
MQWHKKVNAFIYFYGMNYLEAVERAKSYERYVGNRFDEGRLDAQLQYIVIHQDIEEIKWEIVNEHIRGYPVRARLLTNANCKLLFVFDWEKHLGGNSYVQSEEVMNKLIKGTL